MIDSKRGTIYMVQPLEYLGTNTYKIGCSSKNDMLRCKNGYKRGTIYMVIMQTLHPFEVEAEIIATFNRDFTLVAGNEYFAGDEIEMRNKLCNIVLNFDHSQVPAAAAPRLKRGGKVRLVNEAPAGAAAAASEIESYADFVKNNSDIFNEKYSENNFLVDSELLRVWFNLTKKQHFEDMIKKNFKENDDYIIIRPNTNKHGGNNKQIFMLSPNSSKQLCVKTRSQNSNTILNYFIEFEKDNIKKGLF